MSFLKREFGILFALLLLIYLTLGRSMGVHLLLFPQDKVFTGALILVMVLCIFTIVKHANWLAMRFGEPYGTLILTLSVISIEVVLIVMTMLVTKDAKLARDTMYAVLMITMNAFIGLSLIVGGVKHQTQLYNGQGANAYLAVLVPLAVIILMLPNFTLSTNHGTFSHGQSILMIGICVFFYVSFLIIQTVTQRNHFVLTQDAPEIQQVDGQVVIQPKAPIVYHLLFLLMGLVVMILLSKYLASFLDYSIRQAHLPVALGGVIIALLVLLPEGVSAIQAAYHNRLQRSVNLCMGSAVATICLTVPAVLLVGLCMHIPVVLGLNDKNMLLLILTLLLSSITFTPPRTNSLNGMAHFIVFIVYFALIFDVRF